MTQPLIAHSPLQILLVEDIPSLRSIYQNHLKAAGFSTVSAASASEGLRVFQQSGAQVVLLDLVLPDRDGIDLMEDMLRIRPDAAVIVVTADRSIDRAVLAMRAGALDFLVKPVTEERLASAIENARATVALARHTSEPGFPETGSHGFIGQSQPMQEVYERIRSAARTMAPVFVHGENGTGKELCAQTIHALSPRRAAPFITLECAATTAEHFESELFGHVRGAFPGAIADHPGLAAQADGGTLFLDEICELDPAAQPKLLRFLQHARFQPLGASSPVSVNIRVIASSSIPPLEAVRSGRLREELYYRLHVVPIRMPALREHVEDIPPLAEDLLRRYAQLEGRAFEGLAPQTTETLRKQPWPGNVRQLMNVLRAITVMHDGAEVHPDMLPDDMMPQRRGEGLAAPLHKVGNGPLQDLLIGHSLADIERMAIESALARHDGSVPKAARELDVAASTLYRKLDGWRRPEGED